MNFKSAQEIYDFVCAHLIKQKTQSSDKYEACLYRGPKKTKCAVGCVIPDSMYSPKMESKDVFVLIERASDVGYSIPLYIIRYQDLLSRLQDAHDNSKNWVSKRIMRAALVAVGREYGLKISKIRNH